ncbi:phage recombination protein Bet [Salmonella enterica subsp. enterica serovar Oranienburg]|uniref:phage recombination protein Bet n=1 Tax=Salmonella enterica TaxID=28901 RepID=UPI000FA6A7ED|nr:phage recombination protein Bet [Salmonella enterica subsp. enterica serovar Oranienburg]EAQ2767209.1 phage recombination protein Bet [Salmonella enterica]ECC9692050.1 phage recombination protein Bet [Salmonella enterica subsp. enterica]QQL61458.1 phage recombination protein Bet [Salmonella enterica subsp. enterica serovar Othmarschen]EAB9048981.1 phage recombination protein Bet [Salmonella enterica subsp. enterica serovar Oranienburg]
MSTALATLAGKLTERVGMDSVDPQELITTLRQTAFKGDASDAQFIALLIVANQYGLNPWTKEIYAFPDKQNGIVPVVGVDGWSRIINENQQFDGMDFEQDNESCTCRIYRKDRNHPICVTEWMDECRREPFKTRDGREITGPWQSHPKRMLRHKAMIQCARLAFGFAGIYDKDEAERIVENTTYTAARQPERDITPVSDETMQEINDLLITLNKTWDDDLLPLCSQIFRRDIGASSDLTQIEAVKALGFLKQKAAEQKVEA